MNAVTVLIRDTRNTTEDGKPRTYKWPGRVIGDPETVDYTTRDGRKTRVQRINVVSLRETNPDNGPVEKYLRLSDEAASFTPPRASKVIGLDVTEDGELISEELLLDMLADSIAAFNLKMAEASAAVAVDDLV